MMSINDIVKIFTDRGERVVVIMPDHEPVVVMPLAEYESLQVAADSMPRAFTTRVKHQANTPVYQSEPPIEPVEPLGASQLGEDSYFPEPIDED